LLESNDNNKQRLKRKTSNVILSPDRFVIGTKNVTDEAASSPARNGDFCIAFVPSFWSLFAFSVVRCVKAFTPEIGEFAK